MSKKIKFFIHLPLIIYLGMALSCAGIVPKAPTSEPVAKSTKSISSTKGDRLQRTYTNFTIASLRMARGRYEKAQKYLSAAIKDHPRSIFLNRKMAVLLKKMKDFQGAIEYAKKCIDLDSENINNRLLLAEMYARSGDEESAEREYITILELNPNHKRVRLVLITVYIKRKQFKPAMEHLNKLMQQDPNLLIAHYYKGRINYELGNQQEAEKAYLDTLKLNKDMEPALFDLASLYHMGKKYKKSGEIYSRLVRLNPTNLVVRERLIDIYYKLGEEKKAEEQMDELKSQSKPGDPMRQPLGLIYLRHGKFEQSIVEFSQILSFRPEDYKTRYYLASAYEENQEKEKAIKHYRMIKPESDYFIDAQMHIAYILDSQKKHDEAIDVLQKAKDLNKEKIELYLMLSSIFETKKEYVKAMEIIEAGLMQDEKNIDLIFRRGVVLDKSGEKEKCIQEMRNILEIDPNHADALNYIGFTYAEQGIRLNEALVLIQKALKIKPNSGYIIDSLGWVYYQQGFYDKALSSLEKAASLTPNDPTIAEHLGDTYFKKKRYKESLEMYNKSLSLKNPDEKKLKEKINEVKKILKKQESH